MGLLRTNLKNKVNNCFFIISFLFLSNILYSTYTEKKFQENIDYYLYLTSYSEQVLKFHSAKEKLKLISIDFIKNKTLSTQQDKPITLSILKKNKDSLVDAIDLTTKIYKELDLLDSKNKETFFLQSFKEIFHTYLSTLKKVIPDSSNNTHQSDLYFLTSRLNANIDYQLQSIQNNLKELISESLHKYTQLKKTEKSAKFIINLLILFSLGILGVLIFKNIITPLEDLSAFSQYLLNGKLKKNIPFVSDNNEFGNVARSIDFLKDKCKEYYEKVQNLETILEQNHKAPEQNIVNMPQNTSDKTKIVYDDLKTKIHELNQTIEIFTQLLIELPQNSNINLLNLNKNATLSQFINSLKTISSNLSIISNIELDTLDPKPFSDNANSKINKQEKILKKKQQA